MIAEVLIRGREDQLEPLSWIPGNVLEVEKLSRNQRKHADRDRSDENFDKKVSCLVQQLHALISEYTKMSLLSVLIHSAPLHLLAQIHPYLSE